MSREFQALQPTKKQQRAPIRGARLYFKNLKPLKQE